MLSVALFDFFFVPPRFTFTVEDTHYVFTFGVMLVTALAISRLAERVRTESRAAEARERGTAALYPMLGDLGDAKTLDDVTRVIGGHVRAAFGADSRVLLRQAGHLAAVGVASPQPAAQYLPLVGSHGRLGVLEVRPDEPARFDDPAVQWLLQTFAAQAALAIERVSTVA